MTQSLPVLVVCSWLANTVILIYYQRLLASNSPSIFVRSPERLEHTKAIRDSSCCRGPSLCSARKGGKQSQNRSHPFKAFASISYQISTKIGFMRSAQCLLVWQRLVRIFCICSAVRPALPALVSSISKQKGKKLQCLNNSSNKRL